MIAIPIKATTAMIASPKPILNPFNVDISYYSPQLYSVPLVCSLVFLLDVFSVQIRDKTLQKRIVLSYDFTSIFHMLTT
jgi:hypothetical protein